MPLLCSPSYGQQREATYVAANHLSGSFGPADIGTTGVTTTIDAGLYGGTVVFSGSYHVRGIVRLINGTFDLRPGTVFYTEGLSGQSIPNPPFSPIAIYTTIEVENANLELTGATLMSTCPKAWGGVRLSEQGRIRTRANAAATAPAGRCVIQDAIVGVEVLEPAVIGSFATAEYYLNATDFVNNGTGLSDRHTYVARAGTGARYCGFRTDAATLKAPLGTPGYTQFVGAQFWIWDIPLGTNNYAAARLDHCSFHHLDIGVYGTAQQLRITDNTFDYIWSSAIDLSLGGGGVGLFPSRPCMWSGITC